jgi:hypothetical protein
MKQENFYNVGIYIYTKILIFFTALTSFFIPIKGLIIFCISMVLADTIYGIYKAKKLKESITSHKLFNIVPKSVGYLFFILMSFTADTYLFENKLPVIDLTNGLSKIVTLICTLIELKSIDETSIKLGNKPFEIRIKEFVNTIKKFKKNLNDLKDEN